MKFTVDIEINKPLEQVLVLFDSPDNMQQWMNGLQVVEHLSGTAGQTGAKSKLKFNTGKRKIEMIETILERDLPKIFRAKYETRGVENWVSIRFERIHDGVTRYVSENEFRCKGWVKLLAWLMPGAFKKQSLKYLSDFKKFVESQ